jgi:hypothetical protein
MLHLAIAVRPHARQLERRRTKWNTAERDLPMAYKCHLLVMANVTATSSELLEALKTRADSGPTAVTLVVPTGPSADARAAAQHTLYDALTALRDAGLEADGLLGDGDPMIAITEAWDPRRYDEIIVSTLPTSMSKWLHADLPGRIARQTGALVTHVVARPARPAPHAVPVADHDHHGVLTPLSPLTWGTRRVAGARSSGRH